jgi:hypothetical protein
MRSTLLAAAAATTAIVVLAGGHAALASSRTPGRDAATTLTITAHDRSDSNIDVGRQGLSAGDQEISTMKLDVDGQHGGHGTITCLAMQVTHRAAEQQCSGTLSLDGGIVTFFGPTTAGRGGPAPFDWAVTGGTGDYSQASGFLHVVPGNRTVHMTLNLL